MPRRPRTKIRNPKLEISNKLGNPKYEAPNSKQIQIFQVPMHKTSPVLRLQKTAFIVLDFCALSFPFLFRVSDFVLRILLSIYFEFRDSSLELVILLITE